MTRYIVLGALNSLILLAISGSAGFDIVQRCGSLTPCAGPGWGTWLMAGLPILLLFAGAAIFAPRAIRSLTSRRADVKAVAIAAAQSDAAAVDADDIGLSRLARLRAAPIADVDMDAHVADEVVDDMDADFDAGLDSGTETWPVADVDEWEAEEELTEVKADADEPAPLDMPVAVDWAADGDSVDSADMVPDAAEIAPGFAALGDWEVEAVSDDLPAEKWAYPGDDAVADQADDAPNATVRTDPFAVGRDRIVWAIEDDVAADVSVEPVADNAHDSVEDCGEPDAIDCAAGDDWSMPPAISDDGDDDNAFDGADCPPITAFAAADAWSAPTMGAPATNRSPLQQAAWLIAPGPLPRLRAHGETGFPWAAATISAVADSMLDLASPPSLGEFAAEVSAWRQVVAELPAATPIAGDDAAAFNAWLESLAQHLFLFGTSPDLETLLVDALSRLTLAAEGDATLAAMLPAELFPTDARNVA